VYHAESHCDWVAVLKVEPGSGGQER